MSIERMTEQQLEEAIDAGLTLKEIAEMYGMNIRTVERRSSKLSKSGKGHGRNSNVRDFVPDGYMIKGTSTYVDEEGKQVRQWIKTEVDKERQLEIMQAAIDALCSDLPREKPVSLPSVDFQKTLALYPVFDLHIGAMAHKHECGENYDTSTAELLMNKYFNYAVESAPGSERAVLLLGGDFLHYDGMEAKTPTSGHILDSDSRYAKLVYVAMRCTRRAIGNMLKKHRKVDVHIIPGNHDLSGMIWLRAAMAAFYEDEPRVYVDVSPASLHVTHYGKTLLGYCHGHELKKPDTRLSTLARDHRAAFGASEYVYTHSGHWHHATVTEHNLGIDESHGQLGAKDAYSANNGYRSYRQASVIVYSPDFGEVGRFTCRPEMFK